MRKCIAWAVMAVAIAAWGQESPIRWINQTFDYGVVDDPGKETAVFYVENVSDRTVTLRVGKASKGVEVLTSSLTLAPHQQGELRFRVEVGRTGRFAKQVSLRTDDGGRYTLFIRGRAVRRGDNPEECPDLTGRVKYVPPEYSLRVRVLDRSTGHAIRNAAVAVEGRLLASGVTDHEGFYKKTVPVGQYFVRVEKSGYLPSDTFLYVGTSTRLAVIYLEPLHSSSAPETPSSAKPKPSVPKPPAPRPVEIRVVDSATGDPVGRAALAFWQDDHYIGKWYTRSTGEARVTLRPGSYRIEVRHPSYPSAVRRLTVDSSTRRYALQLSAAPLAEVKPRPPSRPTDKGVYHIEVVDAKGRPRPHVRINIYRDGRYHGRYSIPSDGRAVRWEAPQGTYRFSLYDPAHRQRWDTLVSLPPAPARIVLRVPSPPSADSASPIASVPSRTPARPADTVRHLLPPELYRTNNIVFLIDVSSSMKKKMPTLRKALHRLINALRPEDRISVITYATVAHVVSRGVPGDAKDSLHAVVERLESGGLTYGIRGLRKAYELAHEYYVPDGNNQVILITDGEFNSPDYSRLELFRIIKDEALVPIKLSVISLAEKESSDRTLRMAALFGHGSYLQARRRDRLPSILLEEIKKQSRRTAP